MSKLNGTLTQIRWETAAAGNTCAACCRLQSRHLGSIWLIMIYFSCNHLFMPLWFIFRGTGLRAKGLGAGVGKHHQPHGTFGRTHSHSCPTSTWEWTPVLLLPPHHPIPEDAGCSSHMGKIPAFFPQPVLCWRHGPGTRTRTSMRMLFSVHFDQKKPNHEDCSPHLLPKAIHGSPLKCSWSTAATCCYIYAQKKQNPGKIQVKQLLRHWEVSSCVWEILHFSHSFPEDAEQTHFCSHCKFRDEGKIGKQESVPRERKYRTSLQGVTNRQPNNSEMHGTWSCMDRQWNWRNKNVAFNSTQAVLGEDWDAQGGQGWEQCAGLGPEGTPEYHGLLISLPRNGVMLKM